MTVPVSEILDRLRRLFPGWDTARDPAFVEQEVQYKADASALAQQRLAEPDLRRLLGAGDTDAVAERFLEVGTATNLLYQPTYDQGELGPLRDPEHRAATAGALVDLLYGDADTPARVQAFADGLRGRGLQRSWPLATYFLFLVSPRDEMFVKPGVTRTVLQVLGEPFRLGRLNGEDYGRVRHLAHAVRDAMADHGVETMIDVQSLFFAIAEAEKRADGGAPDTVPDDLRARAEPLLEAFAEQADGWLARAAVFGEYHAFFQRFFEPETLAEIEWPDVQAVGRHLHSMQSMALARANAFGNPNHPMPHYRQAFDYLVRGDDPLAVRLNRMRSDRAVQIAYLGDSALGELAGQLFADRYSLYNDRSRWAADLLGLPVPTGGPLGDRFAAFGDAVAPLVALYREVVGARTDWPLRLEVDQFLSWLYETHHGVGDAEPETDSAAPTVWLVAPGRHAVLWESSYDAGELTIGWSSLGDLGGYASRDEMTDRLHQRDPAGPRPSNDSLACWQFAHEMRPGDVVFAKRDRDAILGVGTVLSEYRHEPDRDGHPHVRDIDWTLRGDWPTAPRDLPVKTLTQISKYPDMVAELSALVGMETDDPPRPVRHWWLNVNPKVWSFAAADIGHTEAFTAQNEAGNNRQRYQHFQDARPGDQVVAYESSPVKRVVGLGTVARGLYTASGETEAVDVEKTHDAPDGLTWTALQDLPELADAEPVRNNQGSLFALSLGEFERICHLSGIGIETDPPSDPAPAPSVYTAAHAADGAFAEPDAVAGWVALLRRRKNVILQGPPGVGKTWLARRLARAVIGTDDPGVERERLAMVQFHQSYAYEDFVQGYRPDGTGFALQTGIFYDFVKDAQKQPERPFVFVIDEINRGNLSKIFGELMMLIEADKRGAAFGIPLTYSTQRETRFYVPENVHILGLMNTADRSLAVVDYALRRRFAFVTLEPAVGTERYAAFLRARGASGGLVARIAGRVGALNRQITADSGLGAGFQIGHSYFHPAPGEADASWYRRVVETEIGPLLREYWFDREDEARRAVAALLA